MAIEKIDGVNLNNRQLSSLYLGYYQVAVSNHVSGKMSYCVE